MKTLLLGCVTLFALSVAGVASAGEGDEYTTQDDKDGYSVKFVDDLLQDKNVDSSAALLAVRPHVVRMLLIRPRTSFVPEMFKSAESF